MASKQNKYAQEPEAEIDLHGMKGAEARDALTEFLNKAKKRKLHLVRVIVGKGTHSLNGPVLPDVAKVVLRTHDLGYRYAKQHEGGEGVLVVTL
jgi:DNA-nicking Smr family endonuclease